MVSMLTLSQHLQNNADACIKLLEAMGFVSISYNKFKDEIRFAQSEEYNPNAMRLKVDTLHYDGYSIGVYGNIYSLVMWAKDLSFPQALVYVAKELGLSTTSYKTNIHLPFGGFYKGLIKNHADLSANITTYEQSILDNYLPYGNVMFKRDGIDYITQSEFQVGYDPETSRITIPEYTAEGKLCGVMGRSNDPECAHEDRWRPVIPCSRSLTVYGYHKNYANVQSKNLTIIGESEKFVQQLYSMGCKIGLSTCGCNISDIQAKYLKSLMISSYVVAYDEGLTEEEIRHQTQKLKIDAGPISNNVGYIFDKDHDILKKGSKASPSDLGKEAFNELVKNYVVWL